MLHDLGACNGSVFVDMAHNEHGDLLLFGYRQQTGGALLDLTDRTGRGRKIHTAHRLDRVDDYKLRLFLFNQAADLVHIVLRSKIDVLLRHFQPCSTQFDLTDRFLTRDIQNRMLVGDGTAELQKHRGFANTRFSAEQNHAAQHNAAAQHPVKLRYAGQDAAFLFRSADISQPPGRQRSNPLLPGRCCRFAAGKPCLGRFRNNILIHGIPAAAAGAAAHPARAGFTAVGADVNSFELWFLHGALPAKTPLEKRRSISLFCFSLPHSVVCRNCSLTLPQQR